MKTAFQTWQGTQDEAQRSKLKGQWKLHAILTIERPPSLASRLCCTVVFLVALLLPCTASAWVYETVGEFIGEADLDGDGNPDIVIVDKATGAFRVGYQTAPGLPAWADARASGVTNATGVSLGRVLNTTRDTLVITGPSANRVNLIEATTAVSPALPVSVFLPSLGPNLVSAIDIGGGGNTAHADLYVASQENPGPRDTLMRSTGASQSLITDGALAAYRRNPNTFVLKSGQPMRLGLFNRNAVPGNDSFVVLDFQAGGAATLINFPVPLTNAIPQPQFLASRFDAGNVLAQALFYRPGEAGLLKYQVQEPVPGTFALGGSNGFNLGAPIQQVQLVAGAGTPRLLVIFGASPKFATNATVFTFDGVNPPVPVQSFTSSTPFMAGAALGGGNLTLLTGNNAGNSLDFQNWLASGPGYIAGTSGALPAVTPYSGGANVLLFNAEPFTAPAAKALRTVRAGDWSSGPILGGGPPPSVSVRAEKYGGVSNGLANPSVVSLGTAPVGTTYALVNQYVNPISIFSRRAALGDLPAEVSIRPPPAQYGEAIKVTLSVNTAGWSARYRLTPGAAWTPYVSPVTLYSNVTIQFYAQQIGTSSKTPLQNATYSFIRPAGEIDSDNDGLPDAVEVAKGLDPVNSGIDSDGDGYTDLEEIIRNTNPLNKFNAPTNLPRLDLQQAFDLVTTPRAINHLGNHTLSVTGVLVYAHSLDGRLMATSSTTNWVFAGSTNPAGWMMTLQPIPSDRLVAQATDRHFDLGMVAGDTRVGRELIGLVPVPPPSPPVLPPVDLSLGVGAVNAWIASVSNFLVSLPRTTFVGDVTYRDTLVAGLLEAKVAEILLARGTNSGTNLTLFPFRAPDATRDKLSTDDLLLIECYVSPMLRGFKQQTLFNHFNDAIRNSANADVNSLRVLMANIYRTSAAHNNTNPATLKLPFDELRHFLKTGNVDPAYAAFIGATGYVASAWAGANALLASAPPRPTTNVVIEVVTSGPDVPTTFRLTGSLTFVTLWNKDGSPCALPAGFDILPGSQITVFGHTDITGPPGLPIEVIALSLTSIPIASGADANGNLLVDAWEDLFGGGANDPFGDDDGDGYTNLEEMLNGTDPNNPANIPPGPPANFAPPLIEIMPLGGQISLVFEWPAGYIGSFKFGARSSSTVDGGYGDLLVGNPVPLGGNKFELMLTPPASQNQFFLLTVALQP